MSRKPSKLDEEITPGTFLRWAIGAALVVGALVWAVLKAIWR